MDDNRLLRNGLIIQWYHASFSSNAQRTWTFPIPFTDVNSFTITPTAWANSNDTVPLQYFMFKKESTGIKFMSLNSGEHDFIAIGYQFFLNGLIIQWGSTLANSTTVSFPTSFSVAPKVVATGLRSNGEHRTDNLILLSIGTTSFSFSWFDHGSDYTVNWMAIGY